jgi:hypothetical protein
LHLSLQLMKISKEAGIRFSARMLLSKILERTCVNCHLRQLPRSSYRSP